MQKFMQTIKHKKDSMLESIKNKEGFTLIELIVVMAIIAILVLLAAPRFLGYTKDAEVSAVRQDVKVLSDAALQYNIENEGTWPAVLVDEEDATQGYKATATTPTVVDGEEVVELSEDKLSAYLKNTKNPLASYGLITSGDDAGAVVHLEGIEDRKGNTVFGIGDDLVTVATPEG